MNWNGDAANPVGIEWPYNLIQQVQVETDDPLEHICSEAELLLAMCMSNMTEREKDIVMRRYYHQKTLKEVGEEIGVKQERVRQIEAKGVRKMRNPHCEYIMLHGIKEYINKRVNEKADAMVKTMKEELENEYRVKMANAVIADNQSRRDIVAKLLSTSVEEMDLTVRSYNCLKRAGVNSVGELIKMFPTYERLYTIRNLGRKSLEEVVEKVQGYGFAWPMYETEMSET